MKWFIPDHSWRGSEADGTQSLCDSKAHVFFIPSLPSRGSKRFGGHVKHKTLKAVTLGRLSLGLCWQTDKVEKISQFKLKKKKAGKEKTVFLMSENFVPTIHSLKKRINQQTKKIPSPKQLQLMTHLFQGMFNLTMCQCHRSWQSLELDTVVCLYQEGVWALYLTGNRVSEVFRKNKAFCWQVGPRPLSSCQNGFGLRIVI